MQPYEVKYGCLYHHIDIHILLLLSNTVCDMVQRSNVYLTTKKFSEPWLSDY